MQYASTLWWTLFAYPLYSAGSGSLRSRNGNCRFRLPGARLLSVQGPVRSDDQEHHDQRNHDSGFDGAAYDGSLRGSAHCQKVQQSMCQKPCEEVL